MMIPDTNEREVAMIAAALELALKGTGRQVNQEIILDDYLKRFVKAYETISKTVYDNQPEGQARSKSS